MVLVSSPPMVCSTSMPSAVSRSAATCSGSWPSLTRPRLTRSLALVSLTRELPSGDAAVLVQQPGARPDRRGDRQDVAAEQALVAVPVADDLDLGRQFGVALDQPADGGGQAGGETARGEQRDFAT